MTDPRLQALMDQLDTIFIILQRPVVQQQLAAFCVIFLLSWLLPAPLGVLLNKLINRQATANRRAEGDRKPMVWRARLLRTARGIQLLLFPIVGLVLSQVTATYFENQGMPAGLMVRLTVVFWLVLVHRLIGSVLYASFRPSTANSYQRRFVTPIFVILVTLALILGLEGTFPIIEIELFTIMDTPISLRSLWTAVVVFYIFMAIAWVIQDVLDKAVLPRAEADPGVENTVLVMSRYTIVAIGVMAGLSSLGFNLSSLAIVFGGLSVGIGFGLQELVANFISGILLLFERSLRPGDIIEVGGQQGIVSQLRMRATVLRTYDNIEIFVPNKTLLTSTVSTYTLTSRDIRTTLHVGVSYDSDPTKVRDVLQHVVESYGLVLKDPAPAIYFMGFGESSLDFQIMVWMGDPLRMFQVTSDLHYMIFREFGRNGIEIPYPQRDLHLRTTSGVPWEEMLSERAQESQTVVLEPAQRQDEETTGAAQPAQVQQDGAAHAGEERPEGKATPADRGRLEEKANQRLSRDRVKAPAQKPRLPG